MSWRRTPLQEREKATPGTTPKPTTPGNTTVTTVKPVDPLTGNITGPGVREPRFPTLAVFDSE